MATPVVRRDPLLGCGNCRQLMQRLALPGHYGSCVELDLCPGCDLVWFDLTETAQLTGPALLQLIDTMALSHALPHALLRPDPRCPRCDGRLATVHNQSRWGHSTQLQCERRHGAYQSFAQFLGEKGLLRPMSRIDRARLLRDKGRIDCVNCGASLDAHDEQCRSCLSVPSLLDIARLARAVDPLDTLEPNALSAEPARQGALQCAACGVALPHGETVSCSQCGATLAITSLAEANACVQALAPALREAAAHPSAHVIKRRLDALDADLPRRREWAAAMDAESRERPGLGNESWDMSSWFDSGAHRRRNVAIAVGVFAVVWVIDRWWR
ncbi:MAG: hypothetical protein ABI143_08800 [Caldimonas sp.]